MKFFTTILYIQILPVDNNIIFQALLPSPTFNAFFSLH